MLVHYDPEKPLVLACDVSPFGLGAILSHTLPDGSEKPIAYSFSTLSSSEKSYSQIEKENFAIIFEIKKFHQYKFNPHVTIVTYYKTLLGILSEEKAVPQLAASTLQKWAIILSGYNYTLNTKQEHLIVMLIASVDFL